MGCDAIARAACHGYSHFEGRYLLSREPVAGRGDNGSRSGNSRDIGPDEYLDEEYGPVMRSRGW
jgi:hypothetical protein